MNLVARGVAQRPVDAGTPPLSSEPVEVERLRAELLRAARVRVAE